MTTDEYIDAISRDLQDLINALDNDPNTSALVKGRAKYIQERINTYYDSLISTTKSGTSGDGLFGECEAAYFSHMREFMKSDTAL